jgi:hypothetical protein
VLVLAVFISVFSLLIGSQVAFAATSLSVSDDQNSGNIVVENDVYKAVWKYKSLAQENNNLSGGNLYRLYYKATDPQAINNLVAVANYGNGSSVIWAGIGGAGATRMYAADSSPATYGNNSFSDLIGDNNLSGVLLDHRIEQASDGTIHISITYDVKNQYTGVAWYRITKDWIAYPDGRLALTTNRNFLRDGYISEPGTVFSWDKRGGWTRFEKYGHQWGESNSYNKLISINDINNVDGETWDTLNMFYPRWVRLAGSQSAPDITVEAVGGFDSSGLFNLGRSLWNGQSGATMEQSVFGTSQVTAYAMAWLGWWGGNPPTGARYRHVTAQTSITDNYTITLAGEPAEMQNLPRITNVQQNYLGAGESIITWDTNIPSTSRVKYAETGQSQEREIAVSGTDTRHSVHITGLRPNATYRFNVGESSSLAIQGSGEFVASQSPTVDLSLSFKYARWNSYNDYLSGLLSAQYSVTNQGAVEAASVDITRESSTSGVSGQNLPLSLGRLGCGESVVFDINYAVPHGVSAYHTELYGIATDNGGNQRYFPSDS